VSAGGTDDDANTIWLCPNHHSIAHALFCGFRGAYFGPRERAAVIEAIRVYERDPSGWVARAVAGAVSGPTTQAADLESRVLVEEPAPVSRIALTAEPASNPLDHRAFRLSSAQIKFLDFEAKKRGSSQGAFLRDLLAREMARAT